MTRQTLVAAAQLGPLHSRPPRSKSQSPRTNRTGEWRWGLGWNSRTKLSALRRSIRNRMGGIGGAFF